MNNVLYLTDILDSQNCGWLTIENIAGKKFSLPYLSQIKQDKKPGDFVIMTGPYINNVVREKKFNNHYYKFFSLHRDTTTIDKIELNIKEKTISVGGIITKVEFLNNSFSRGKYLVLHPVKTSKIMDPRYYREPLGGSRFAGTWFPIISETEKYPVNYLHFGKISNGCIVVPYSTDGSMGIIWSNIFKKLAGKINDSILLCKMEATE